MSRNHSSGRSFPYAERAAAVEAARAAVKVAFRAMRAAGCDRRDMAAAQVVAWKAAVRELHTSIDRAYPPDFREAVAALRRADRAGVEAAIGFLEADPWFFRSGYVKERLLTVLKRVELAPDEAERLRHVILAVVDRRDGRELRRYCRLARKVDAPALRDDLRARLSSADAGTRRRAGWVLDALGEAGPGPLRRMPAQ